MKDTTPNPTRNALTKTMHEVVSRRHEQCKRVMNSAGADFYLLDVQGKWACHGDTANKVKAKVKKDATRWQFSSLDTIPESPIPQAACVAVHMWQAVEELSQHGSIALLDIRQGKVAGTWEHYVVAVIRQAGQPVEEDVSEEDAV